MRSPQRPSRGCHAHATGWVQALGKARIRTDSLGLVSPLRSGRPPCPAQAPRRRGSRLAATAGTRRACAPAWQRASTASGLPAHLGGKGCDPLGAASCMKSLIVNNLHLEFPNGGGASRGILRRWVRLKRSGVGGPRGHNRTVLVGAIAPALPFSFFKQVHRRISIRGGVRRSGSVAPEGSSLRAGPRDAAPGHRSGFRKRGCPVQPRQTPTALGAEGRGAGGIPEGRRAPRGEARDG